MDCRKLHGKYKFITGDGELELSYMNGKLHGWQRYKIISLTYVLCIYEYLYHLGDLKIFIEDRVTIIHAKILDKTFYRDFKIKLGGCLRENRL